MQKSRKFIMLVFMNFYEMIFFCKIRKKFQLNQFLRMPTQFSHSSKAGLARTVNQHSGHYTRRIYVVSKNHVSFFFIIGCLAFFKEAKLLFILRRRQHQLESAIAITQSTKGAARCFGCCAATQTGSRRA